MENVPSPDQAGMTRASGADPAQSPAGKVNDGSLDGGPVHDPGQAQHFQAPPLSPAMGYVVNPATGQVFAAPVQPAPQGYAQAVYVQPQQAGVPPQQASVPPQAAEPVYVYAMPAQQPLPQEPPPPPQPDVTQIMTSVEKFAQGEATVADVVKTLYAQTAGDDQFWKGAIVGAAATVLLTSDSVRGAMGKTFGSLFGSVFGGTAAPDRPGPAAATQGRAPEKPSESPEEEGPSA